MRVTSLDRVILPPTFTKAHLLAYYLRVAPRLLPHLAGRPATLRRFPEGATRPEFFQTRAPAHPEWVRTVELAFRTGTRLDAVVIDDLASLVWAVNLSTVEVHPFLGRVGSLDRPTAVVFDLDPGPPAGHRECAEVALAVRDRLAAAGRAAAVKTSGSLGLHVFAPADEGYPSTKQLAREIARELAADRPDLVVDVMRRSERPGRVFIDWSQNDPGKSTVAAWSLRGVGPVPTASIPVGWDEVAAAALPGAAPLPVSVRAALERLDREELFPPTLPT